MTSWCRIFNTVWNKRGKERSYKNHQTPFFLPSQPLLSWLAFLPYFPLHLLQLCLLPLCNLSSILPDVLNLPRFLKHFFLALVLLFLCLEHFVPNLHSLPCWFLLTLWVSIQISQLLKNYVHSPQLPKVSALLPLSITLAPCFNCPFPPLGSELLEGMVIPFYVYIPVPCT